MGTTVISFLKHPAKISYPRCRSGVAQKKLPDIHRFPTIALAHRIELLSWHLRVVECEKRRGDKSDDLGRCEQSAAGWADFQLPFSNAERAGCTESGHLDSDAVYKSRAFCLRMPSCRGFVW